MQGERSRAVVNVMISRIPAIHDTIVLPADRSAFETWVREFLRPIANAVGDSPTRGETDELRGLRSDVFGMLAKYGRDPLLVSKSRSIVDTYMKVPNSVDAELAGNALGI